MPEKGHFPKKRTKRPKKGQKEKKGHVGPLTEFMTHSTKEKHKQKLISNFEFCFRGCFLTKLDFLHHTLRENDREFHYLYLRMSRKGFDHLLSLVFYIRIKTDTRLRETITVEERLYGWSQSDSI